VSPLLPLTAIPADTSLLEVRNHQRDVEIKLLSDELTSRNTVCAALQSQVSSLTADFEKARVSIRDQNSAIEILNNELAASRSQLESVKTRFTRELADKDALLVTAHDGRDAALGRIDAVRKMVVREHFRC
jgi:chromosome segregation ATPase